jgi:glycosyltransferase involved in cell wall biosynthesis
MTQGVRLTIVGKNPPEAVKKLANSSPQAAEIRITGYVVDPTPYLEQAGVFIVPLHSGSGMRVKIVEAWARGLPVVSTKVGAEGLRYIDGENILIADGAEAFAEAVAKVLNDPELNRRLRENGRRWVVAHYDWRQVYTAWDAIY